MPIGVNVLGTNKQATMKVNVGGTWKLPIGWVRENGEWKKFQNPEFTYTISQNTANFNLFSAIGNREETIINLVINSGVNVYSTNVGVPALLIPNSFVGKTINVINNGNIYGQGGVGGTGVGQAGGPALRVQTSQKINLTNNGTIAGGGGGGGKGGTGGGGSYVSTTTVREPTSGWATYGWDTPGTSAWRRVNSSGRAYLVIYWNGPEIYRGTWNESLTSLKVGEYTYYKGPSGGGAFYTARSKAVSSTVNTNGGVGGNGGNGQGFSQAVTNGLAGAAGGTNAGTGGKGGTGGTFGVAGSAGASGASGNRTAGSAGSAGGAAGAAVDGTSKINYINAGKLLGPLIN